MIIETQRMILRPPQPEDAPALCHILRQEFVLKYNCMAPPESPEKLNETQEARKKEGEIQLVLVLRESGQVLGMVGIDRDRLRYGVDSVNLDYWLGQEFARQGYMSEALEGVLEYLFCHRKLRLVSARVFTQNIASLTLLERLGFTREGTLRQAVRAWGDVVYDDALFSMLREDYQLSRKKQ